MSVETVVYLPGDACLDDVADVMGIALGLPVTWKMEDNAEWVHVEGVEVKPSSDPVIAHIRLIGNFPLIDSRQLDFRYHFESPDGGRMIRLLSTPLWVALGQKLVEFFGGEQRYRDETVDLKYHRPRIRNNPEEDKEWDAFQKAKSLVRPLVRADIEYCRPFSAYPESF